MKVAAIVPRYEGLGENEAHGNPVPKNGKFIAITNSERLLSACPKRWWFRHSERLDTESGAAARLGSAFHEVMEDIWGWWRDEDSPYPAWALRSCIRCDALKKSAPTWAEEDDCRCCDEHKAKGPMGPIDVIASRWHEEFVDCDEPLMTFEEWQTQVQALTNMCEGYLIRWGHGPPVDYRVVGVELTLAAPIMDGDKPFKTNVPIVDEGDHLRMAARADKDVKMIRWPWYQIGKIDALIQHRETGALWIVEHKTSKSPKTYFEALSVDPQTTGYIWLLRSMCERGLFGPELQAHPNPVAGYLYDVVSSANQPEPQRLKSGKFSTAKRNTPSWMYEKAIAGEADKDAYSDHVQYLRENVDMKLYQREWGTVGEADVNRYRNEIVGVAERNAKMRRDMVSGKNQDRMFPRQPVCMRGFCSYKSICTNDSDAGRSAYVEGSVQKWDVEGVEKEPETGMSEQAEILPF